MSGFAKAVAHSNIALAKYWGKADTLRNLTAVPSLSLTLAALRTTTSVRFDPALDADELSLGGERVSGRPLDRVVKLLDTVRAEAGIQDRARVESVNDFPTAAGLASSASGFAALAMAASRAAGLECVARAGGARSPEPASKPSAARSVYGGYVALAARAEFAERVREDAAFPLEMLVAVTVSGPKATASTDGMGHTQDVEPATSSRLGRTRRPPCTSEVRRAVEAADSGRARLRGRAQRAVSCNASHARRRGPR